MKPFTMAIFVTSVLLLSLAPPILAKVEHSDHPLISSYEVSEL